MEKPGFQRSLGQSSERLNLCKLDLISQNTVIVAVDLVIPSAHFDHGKSSRPQLAREPRFMVARIWIADFLDGKGSPSFRKPDPPFLTPEGLNSETDGTIHIGLMRLQSQRNHGCIIDFVSSGARYATI